MVEQVSHTRILVVDDEASIVDSVATVLRYEDFEVEVAHTGRRAIEMVSSGHKPPEAQPRARGRHPDPESAVCQARPQKYMNRIPAQKFPRLAQTSTVLRPAD